MVLPNRRRKNICCIALPYFLPYLTDAGRLRLDACVMWGGQQFLTHKDVVTIKQDNAA